MYYSANKRANNVGHYVSEAVVAAAATEITKKDVRFADGKKTKQSYKITWRQSRFQPLDWTFFRLTCSLTPLHQRDSNSFFFILIFFFVCVHCAPSLSNDAPANVINPPPLFFIWQREEKTLFRIDRYVFWQEPSSTLLTDCLLSGSFHFKPISCGVALSLYYASTSRLVSAVVNNLLNCRRRVSSSRRLSRGWREFNQLSSTEGKRKSFYAALCVAWSKWTRAVIGRCKNRATLKKGTGHSLSLFLSIFFLSSSFPSLLLYFKKRVPRAVNMNKKKGTLSHTQSQNPLILLKYTLRPRGYIQEKRVTGKIVSATHWILVN